MKTSEFMFIYSKHPEHIAKKIVFERMINKAKKKGYIVSKKQDYDYYNVIEAFKKKFSAVQISKRLNLKYHKVLCIKKRALENGDLKEDEIVKYRHAKLLNDN